MRPITSFGVVAFAKVRRLTEVVGRISLVETAECAGRISSVP
jgi:hypothetical protein